MRGRTGTVMAAIKLREMWHNGDRTLVEADTKWASLVELGHYMHPSNAKHHVGNHFYATHVAVAKAINTLRSEVYQKTRKDSKADMHHNVKFARNGKGGWSKRFNRHCPGSTSEMNEEVAQFMKEVDADWLTSSCGMPVEHERHLRFLEEFSVTLTAVYRMKKSVQQMKVKNVLKKLKIRI